MRRGLLILLALLLGWGAISSWQQRTLKQPTGVLAPDPPRQTDIAHGAQLQHGKITLTTRAQFELTARVLSRTNYRWDDGAALAPVDLALGWGRMSDSAVLTNIQINQSARFYHWHIKAFPISRREIETSSANMHLIPANTAVDRAIKHVRPGQLVRLQGFLVDASRADGWYWNSSMTRDDTGTGACELTYVKSLQPQ